MKMYLYGFYLHYFFISGSKQSTSGAICEDSFVGFVPSTAERYSMLDSHTRTEKRKR